MKTDQTAKTVSLDSDDMQLMTEAITEAAQSSFKSIEERQEEPPGIVTDLLKVLCKVVEEVKIVGDGPSATEDSQAPSKTSRMEQTVAFVPTLLIMVQVPKAVVKCGTPEYNLDFLDTN